MNAVHDRVSDVRNVHADIVGIAEIAELAGVKASAVVNWRVRRDDFPAPVAELRAGPVFSRPAVRKWLKRNRKETMAHVISTINLKGGVGKTTVTVGIAEMLVHEHHQNVLVIDLDPQTNATVMLVEEHRWRELDEEGATVAQLFADALEEEPSARSFSLEQALQQDVGQVSEMTGLDLLPSSLRLIDVQDRLATMPLGKYFTYSPSAILETAVKHTLDQYDFVLIDCPPNLGLITLNGLRISDSFIIPTIPDVLSTYGIPQILHRVADFAAELNEPIEPLGIVINKYRAASVVHGNTLDQLENNSDYPDVFDTVIPEGNAIAAGAENVERGTLRQRYAYQGGFEKFAALTDEIIEAVGAQA